MKRERRKPFSIWVLFGERAIDQYIAGQYSVGVLRDLGPVHHFSFGTVQELNAFVRGVELAQGTDEAICVDDLFE